MRSIVERPNSIWESRKKCYSRRNSKYVCVIRQCGKERIQGKRNSICKGPEAREIDMFKE